MRKLKLQVQLSVDGYLASVDEKTDWFVWNWGEPWTWDEELKKYHNDLTSSVDCILLSRKMAVEGFVHHWAAAALRGGDQSRFAKKIGDAKKIVFSKTLDKSVWDNTTIAKGNFVDEINELKRQEGKDIIAYGGATFVSSLIRARLVDEYHLFFNPVVLGKGLPIFGELDTPMNLNPVSAKKYPSGMTVVRYDAR
jgi:dihydrofolate reductase